MNLTSDSVGEHALRIPVGGVTLDADLHLPTAATGLVLFAHGSGSSRFSPRNRRVAKRLNSAALATVLADLLTRDEETVDASTGEHRFDIGLLTERLIGVADWLRVQPPTAELTMGCFGASTGAAAALAVAAQRPDMIAAVVSRGGRPDLAGAEVLRQVRAPTLLIVGGNDPPVLDLNREAMALLPGEKELIIVPRATHLFEEAGALDTVASRARDWFTRHLTAQR